MVGKPTEMTPSNAIDKGIGKHEGGGVMPLLAPSNAVTGKRKATALHTNREWRRGEKRRHVEKGDGRRESGRRRRKRKRRRRTRVGGWIDTTAVDVSEKSGATPPRMTHSLLRPLSLVSMREAEKGRRASATPLLLSRLPFFTTTPHRPRGTPILPLLWSRHVPTIHAGGKRLDKGHLPPLLPAPPPPPYVPRRRSPDPQPFSRMPGGTTPFPNRTIERVAFRRTTTAIVGRPTALLFRPLPFPTSLSNHWCERGRRIHCEPCLCHGAPILPLLGHVRGMGEDRPSKGVRKEVPTWRGIKRTTAAFFACAAFFFSFFWMEPIE